MPSETEQQVTLRPIAAGEYEAWLENLIRNYAEEKVAAGNWTADEALERSRGETTQLLPQGAATPGQHIFSIVAEGEPEPVGVLWFAAIEARQQAFIYDLEIHAPYRRRGYAERAMRAAEGEVRALGLESIGLHVFGHNHAARRLYEKLGYAVTNLNMVKRVSGE
jgi:ribosomal protein S18 acetylase RimI-like enzyme